MGRNNGTLEDLNSVICGKDYLGFFPTSNGTRPPHIANGLFRLCAGETCDTHDVHKWVLGEEKKNAYTSEQIIEEYEDVLYHGHKEKTENVRDFRFLLGQIFNQDNTTYPSYDYSVVTQSSHWLIRERLSNEAYIGDFAYSILSKRIEEQRSPAIDTIHDALSVDTDDITRLVKPIIAYPSMKDKRHLQLYEKEERQDIPWDSCKEAIRKGFDRLTENLYSSGETKNSLLVLQRFVNYTMFATLLYLSHAASAIYDLPRPPILIDAGCELESIKKASEQSFTSAKKAVEDYYVYSVYTLLTSDKIENNDKACKQWIEDMVISGKKDDDTIREAVKSYYSGFLANNDPPLMALSKAVQLGLYTFTYKNNSPSDFCRVLGVRCGLVGPKGNTKHKRYTVDSFTLETIILSALSSQELKYGIDMKQFGDRLVDSYNILIGSNVEREYEILSNYNIAQSTPEDLRGDLGINAQKLAETLISLGLAKSYADGVTLVGWGL